MASVSSGADIRRLEDTVLEQAENNREHVEDQVKALKTQLAEAVIAEKNDLVGALKAQIAELKDELAHRPVLPAAAAAAAAVLSSTSLIMPHRRLHLRHQRQFSTVQGPLNLL